MADKEINQLLQRVLPNQSKEHIAVVEWESDKEVQDLWNSDTFCFFSNIITDVFKWSRQEIMCSGMIVSKSINTEFHALSNRTVTVGNIYLWSLCIIIF